MNFKLVLGVLSMMLTTPLFAQSKQHQIRLLDFESSMPVSDAHYQYGSQSGISNQDGLVSFEFNQEESMNLSHINYGSWSIGPKELLELLDRQVYYLKPIAVDLYPVTVIGIKKQNNQPDESLKIQYSDRMEHDGAQILNQLPAFSSIQKGGNYGFDPVFRGFKYDQLNIVLNGGQSATAACPNRMDPPISQMAPNMMDRIEVLKGPYALRYGTGFGATINFIPAKLRFTTESDIYGRVSSAYEANGAISRGEAQLGFNGENYDLSFFSSWSEGSDYTSGNGSLIQADFERGSFGANLGFKVASNQQLRISSTYNRARNVDFPATPMDLREDDTWLFNARHDVQINKDQLQRWNTSLFGSFVNHLMDNLLKPLDPRMLNADTSAKTVNYGGRTEGVWVFKGNTLFAGADLRVEGAQGTRVREILMGPMKGKIFKENAWQDGRISKSSLFAEYQINSDIFDYIVSGRLEYNRAHLNDPTDGFAAVNPDLTSSQINPSISLGILKNNSENLKTGLWLGSARRSGGLIERFINFFPVGQDPYEMLGNPNLKPEVNNQVDLTLEWSPNSNASLSVDLFTSYMKDYISSVIDTNLSPVLPMSPGVRQFVNIDRAFKAGYELNWTQQIFGLQHQLGVAYTYGQDLERDQPLPEIAPFDFRYLVAGEFMEGRLRPELMFRTVSKQSRIATEFGESTTPSFSVVDINLTYQLSNQLTVKSGANNVLDENYYEHLSRSVRGSMNPIYAMGRSLYINLNYSF